MPARGTKIRNISAKTPALNASDTFCQYVLRMLCAEDKFPKRSRWLFGGKIADLVNDFHTCIFLANEIHVETARDRDERHHQLNMALAHLMAIDAKMNLAMRVLDIEPNKLEHYAKLANDCRSKLLAWKTSDEKRYGTPTFDGSISESVIAILVDMRQMLRAWIRPKECDVPVYDSDHIGGDG